MDRAGAAGAKTLGQRLRRARLARDMTQGELAKGKFSVSYVSAVERGQIRPSLGALTRLAEALNISIVDLLSDGQPVEIEHGTATADETSLPAPALGGESMLDLLVESEARIAGGRPEEVQIAVQMLSDALGRVLQPYEAAYLRWLLAEAAWRNGDLLAARTAAHHALSHAEGAQDAFLIAKVRLLLARTYHAAGDSNSALSSARICLRVLDESDMRDPMLTVEALGLLGRILEGAGQPVEGKRAFARATAVCEQGKVTPRAIAETYSRLSAKYSRRGIPLAARYYLLRSVAAYEQDHAEAEREQVRRALSALPRAYEVFG